MDAVNRQFLLAARPVGAIKTSDFRAQETPVPVPGPGQALVRTLYLSLDPSSRTWMNESGSYMPAVGLGEVMRGVAIGQVITSDVPGLSPGDLVDGLLGWQDYAVVGAGSPVVYGAVPRGLGVPIPTLMGALGMTGRTAYFGVREVGRPQPGETFVVSAAAGATGSIAGQIAKIAGARVVGIAGSDEKCAWLTEELGFDAAVNYKRADFRQALKAACPRGVDVNFENVGGEILDAVLPLMNLHGRVALCGLISSYNASKPGPGPYGFPLVLLKRLTVQGFLILDYAPRFREAAVQLGEWVRAGKIKARDTIVEGLEQAPEAVNRLFTGDSMGKLLIRVSEPPLPIP